MQRLHTALHWAVVVSAASHVFCCILPTVISLFSIMAGFGILSALMPAFEHMHDVLHAYETQILVFSGAMLALGWTAQAWSWRVDCHDTGCHHGSCSPKKRRASRMLWVASGLFIFNMLTILFVH